MREEKNETDIKIMLNRLAEFLQTKLSDDQIKMYAKELSCVDKEQLGYAISKLINDPELYPGKFPLPAKIKQYIHGSIADRAVLSANKILSISSWADAKDRLNDIEFHVAKRYGISVIVNRTHGSTSVLYAQIRDLMDSALNNIDTVMGDIKSESAIEHRNRRLICNEESGEAIQASEETARKMRSLLHAIQHGKDTES